MLIRGLRTLQENNENWYPTKIKPSTLFTLETFLSYVIHVVAVLLSSVTVFFLQV